ncbi:tRNA lysidine(34) synthetase TilS [Allosphingosinicella sp.]|jgi:tRNA(Ile)-lysidine synthase|uniref:tRNA lysidine(34) synthetase TilS n=1 Tax=Allosphingosinicella sp. TaxID=2823234 RepID=UPI002EE093FB
MASEDQIGRFRRDLESLTGGTPVAIGLAVSGGPDSLALLLLANAACPGLVRAATVDHGLRPESADEARFVAGLCSGLGVPHAILLAPGAIGGASVQAQARALRYRMLGDWAGEHGLAWIATAHHMDDQAETVLMRLARGSGLAGLSSVRARRAAVPAAIVRPLLGWRRSELASIVEQAGIAAVDDPSNRCEHFDRTRFRALLARTDALPVPRLAASASHLAEAEEALEWAAEREWQERAAVRENCVSLDPAGLPPELVRRLAARAVGEVHGDREWRSDKLAAALAQVATGGRVNIAGVRISGGDRWRFEPEPPRRSVAGGADSNSDRIVR